ncbi:MAG: type II secretion system protein [Candidatus Omnitrophica bacterium]|nr:type II secretion system protein [Candidatus Omnitrophota bacterium]
MKKHRTQQAFTLVEVMVMTMLLGIIMTAASMVFVSGQNLFTTTSAQSDLQASVVQALKRISFELQDSGRDSNGNFKVSILDNAGQFSTDILRFAVPICVCGISPINASGNVATWGAPLVWGQNDCAPVYVVTSNGKVDICHFPPGNPNNSNNLSVSPNAIKAHLAHGDYIGNCNACSPSNYTNKNVEYLVDNNHMLLRRILDSNNAPLRSTIISQQVTGFQAVVNNDQTAITITVQATGTGAQGRPLVLSNNVDVLLRNR